MQESFITLTIKMSNLNKENIINMNKSFGAYRFVYNSLLEDYFKNKQIRRTDEYISIVRNLMEQYEWLNQINHVLIKDCIHNFKRTIISYLRSNYEISLRFKTKKSKQSIRFRYIVKEEIESFGIDLTRITDKLKYVVLQKNRKNEYFIYLYLVKTNKGDDVNAHVDDRPKTSLQ